MKQTIKGVEVGCYKYVILMWLMTQRNSIITYHQMLDEIQGFEKYLINELGTHTAIHGIETCGRRFREIKDNSELLKLWGLKVEKINSNGKNYDEWLIEPFHKPVVELETENKVLTITD